MVTHSSILARRIPGTKESGGLQSVGLQSQTRLSNWHTFFFLQISFFFSYSAMTKRNRLKSSNIIVNLNSSLFGFCPFDSNILTFWY